LQSHRLARYDSLLKNADFLLSEMGYNLFNALSHCSNQTCFRICGLVQLNPFEVFPKPHFGGRFDEPRAQDIRQSFGNSSFRH